MRFVITFKQSSPFLDRFAIVEAPNEMDARAQTDATWPHDWSGIYGSEEEAGVEKFGLTELGGRHNPNPSRSASDPSVTVRLRPDLLARVNRVCDERTVGRRVIIEHALESYLELLEDQWDL